ncbi:MAG: TonB-dependent receptor plug domain-containing protein [Desulfobacterales bacterium]|nr:TonB-dependent receptor plug domain-containing protein [Desulfobacterales bacterium]
MKWSAVGSSLFRMTVAAAVSSMAFLLPAFAQEQSAKTYRMDEIEVVAAPIIQGNVLDRYAAQKTLVSEDQINDLNAQDLASALRKTPGVNISRYNMIGSFGGAEGGAVFIRGQGSSRPGAEIKALVDGVPMYMSVWNHPLLDLMSIDPAHMIEVYKSPQPQNFGNAFAIVNILPKRMEDEGFQTRVQTAGGTYSTFIANGDHGGKIGAWDYFAGGGYRTADGHRDDSGGELKNLFGRVGYQLNPHWDLSVFALWNDNYSRDPGEKGAPASLQQGKYETRSFMTVATMSNRFERADGYVKVYQNTGDGDWLGQPRAGGVKEDLYNDFKFYGLKAREAFRFWKGGEIITGLDWEYAEGDYKQKFSNGARDQWNGEDFIIVSPYAAVSQLIGDKEGFFVIPSGGIRYYDNNEFDSEWAPHAGIILGYKNTEIFAGYARGIIYPGLDVMVFSEKVIPALRDTWKNLNAEKVDHYEVGIRHRFGTLAMADLTFFYDDGKDRYIVVPPPPPPPVYNNVEKFQTKGVEATLTVFPFKNVSVFGGATYLETDPNDLPYAPKFTASAGLNWRFLENFKLSLDCQYVSDFFTGSQARRLNAENTNEVDNYFILNGKLAYLFDVQQWGMAGEVYVAGENLTDTDYEYRPNYPMPGATGMVGIQLKF